MRQACSRCAGHIPPWGSKAQDLSVNLREGFTGKSRFLASMENLVKLSRLPTCSRVILHVPRKVSQVCVAGVLLVVGPGENSGAVGIYSRPQRVMLERRQGGDFLAL